MVEKEHRYGIEDVSFSPVHAMESGLLPSLSEPWFSACLDRGMWLRGPVEPLLALRFHSFVIGEVIDISDT